MSTHKYMDRICVAFIVIALILAVLFMNFTIPASQEDGKIMGYEDKLFTNDKVHTIDIIIDDWETFLSTAQSEEYSVCSVIIDGETVKNVGIRGKGNTSLSTVSSMDSERYSFKIEFDQYDSNQNYYGLDKLCLNNIIQDNTYMKDYLTYQMMDEFDVDAPLCSYAYITVNGEEWGLYLAVEAVEESFLQRNYGNDYGELYKPDSMSFGGGRGNGKDFEMPDFTEMQESMGKNFEGFGNAIPDFSQIGQDDMSQMPVPDKVEQKNDEENNDMPQMPSGDTQGKFGNNEMQMPDMEDFGGMGSSDVKLQYIDDNPDSYGNIFDNAKTNVTEADQNRLISSLKQLSEYTDLENVVDIEEVLRYFVVHNFVVNGDSYTGNMIHNYYLYEENGRLSMIPWDYNLAFGTFQGGSASSSVNAGIDEVLEDRPMQAWIFSDEKYSKQYYELYAQMLEEMDIQGIIDSAYELIAPYVEKDSTAFCTYAEFQTGVETLKEFCALRAESVKLQLDGSTETVETNHLNISDMGTMNQGMGGFGGKKDFDRAPLDNKENFNDTDMMTSVSESTEMLENITDELKSQGKNMGKPDFNNKEMSANNIFILVVISVFVFIAGLLIAIKFKH